MVFRPRGLDGLTSLGGVDLFDDNRCDAFAQGRRMLDLPGTNLGCGRGRAEQKDDRVRFGDQLLAAAFPFFGRQNVLRVAKTPKWLLRRTSKMRCAFSRSRLEYEAKTSASSFSRV